MDGPDSPLDRRGRHGFDCRHRDYGCDAESQTAFRLSAGSSECRPNRTFRRDADDRPVSTARATVGNETAAAGVDRLDVRPDKGFMKVRFEDRLATEVTLAIHTGKVLSIGPRDDVFLEKLHSGEIFGNNWILLSDALAIGLLILMITGAWIWLYPKART